MTTVALYPAAAEPGVTEEKVELPFGDVLVRRAGTGDPLVVLHRDIGGFGWTPFNRELAQAFTLHAVSMPGFDGSDRPDWLRNVSQLAVLVGNVFDRMGLASVPVIGLGFGGWVAAELMTLHPARVSAALLQAPMGVKPPEGEIFDQFLFAAPDYVRAGFGDDAMYNELFGDEPDEDQLFTWELNREMLTRIGWKPYMYNNALPHLLRSVTAPVMLVRGTEDRIVPSSCIDAYAASLLDASREELRGGGHFLDIESPSELARVAREFFSSVA